MSKRKLGRVPHPTAEEIDPNMSLADVPRNDLRAAESFYRSRDSQITGDEWRVLWHLQDRPQEFERRSRQWQIVESEA